MTETIKKKKEKTAIAHLRNLAGGRRVMNNTYLF
jgi:hypothetical protein